MQTYEEFNRSGARLLKEGLLSEYPDLVSTTTAKFSKISNSIINLKVYSSSAVTPIACNNFLLLFL